MRTLLLLLLLPFAGLAQTYGPNNPTVGANNNAVGTNAWTNPGNILTSNNNDATVSTRNLSQYVQGTGFGFGLLSTDVVAGIRLDVERSTSNVQNVAILNNWVTGTTRTLSAGTDRCLVVVIGLENTTTRDITAVTYGGRPLTQLADAGLATPFYARTEVWYLLESQLALAANTTITFTYGASVPLENFEIVASAVYQNVDQTAPFNDFETASTTSSNVNYQLPAAMNTLEGSMSVMGIFCGNPPDPMQALGNCDAFSINGGFTEAIDFHAANGSFTSSGGVLMVATRASTAAGTVQPTFTFEGSPNRRTVVGFSLRRARNMDSNVRLRKASGYVGSNYALTATEWPTTDASVSYGGANDLWGTSWTVAEINNANFGAGLSVNVQNATATVDHMRIGVYTTSILPLKLVAFNAYQEEQHVACSWVTASERDVSHFEVERSSNGSDFVKIGTVDAFGDSQTAISYGFNDEHPSEGLNYYRLRMVDENGGYEYSDIISVRFEGESATTVYPNPASDWATVMTPEGFDEIVITDAQGHIVDRFEGSSLQTKQDLNLYDMQDGVYFVCVKSAAGTVEIKKLTKTTRSN